MKELLPRTLFIPPPTNGHIVFVKNLEMVVHELCKFQKKLRIKSGKEQAKQLLSELRMKRNTFQQRLSAYMQKAVSNLIELEKRTYIRQYIDTGAFPSDSLFSMKNADMRKHYYQAACRKLLEYGRHIEDKTAAIKEIEHANKKEWFNQFYHTELHWNEPSIESEPYTRISVKISDTVWNYLDFLTTYLNISRQAMLRQLFRLSLKYKFESSSFTEEAVKNFSMILSYHAITHQKIGTLTPTLNPLNIEQAQNIMDNFYTLNSRYSEPEPLGKYIYSLFPNIVRKPFNDRKKYREQRFLRIVGVPYNAPVPKFDNT